MMTCTLWRVHCDVYIMTCTLWRVHYDVCIMTCTLWRVYCDVCIMTCTLWRVHCDVYIMTCTLWRVQCWRVHCDVYTVTCIWWRVHDDAYIIWCTMWSPIGILFYTSHGREYILTWFNLICICCYNINMCLLFLWPIWIFIVSQLYWVSKRILCLCGCSPHFIFVSSLGRMGNRWRHVLISNGQNLGITFRYLCDKLTHELQQHHI